MDGLLGCIERGRKSQWVDSESSASVSVVRSFHAAEEKPRTDVSISTMLTVFDVGAD